MKSTNVEIEKTQNEEALSDVRFIAPTPNEVPALSLSQKKKFARSFKKFDTYFSQLKSFTCYSNAILADFGITEEEYELYAAHYKNVIEEIKTDTPDTNDSGEEDVPVDTDYELLAFNHIKIDYEYILNLIQNIVTPDAEEGEMPEEEIQKKIQDAREYIVELSKDNPKLGALKESADYSAYKESVKEPLPKFKYRTELIKELKIVIEAEILPLTRTR